MGQPTFCLAVERALLLLLRGAGRGCALLPGRMAHPAPAGVSPVLYSVVLTVDAHVIQVGARNWQRTYDRPQAYPCGTVSDDDEQVFVSERTIKRHHLHLYERPRSATERAHSERRAPNLQRRAITTGTQNKDSCWGSVQSRNNVFSMLKSTVEGETACKVHVSITERDSHSGSFSRKLAQRNEHKTLFQMFSLRPGIRKGGKLCPPHRLSQAHRD